MTSANAEVTAPPVAAADGRKVSDIPVANARNVVTSTLAREPSLHAATEDDLDPFPPLPLPLPHPAAPSIPVTRRRVSERAKKGKGRASTNLSSLGLGAPPPARPGSPTTPTPAHIVSEARKRRRAEADEDGDPAPSGPVRTIITPPRREQQPASATREPIPAQQVTNEQPSLPEHHAEDEDVVMNETPAAGDERDIDTHGMMNFYNVSPYDIRPHHLPPPVQPSPHATRDITNATEHDPANIREGRHRPSPPRVAPPHLACAYRTEIDENGNVRPSHPGPPTRIPNTRPPAVGEFGHGADYDKRAFRAATFHAPPYQLHPGSDYPSGRQGA